MPKRTLLPNTFYHLYNRGVEKRNIFMKPANWIFFLNRLSDYLKPELGELIAYCLMPNHYHLLINVKDAQFGHKVMQPFGVSYTKAINKQENRVGPLFQGPYQPKMVTGKRHLLTVARYIYLNPVAAGFVDHPTQWAYSSYEEAIGRLPHTIAKPQILYDLCGGPAALQQFVESPHSVANDWWRGFEGEYGDDC